jgi:adenine deaminase
MVVGVDDKAMADCVNYLARTGGGMIALNKNKRVFHALEVAGLMSIRPAKKVAESYKKVKAGAKKLGTPLDNIFMTLSFLALPVIPELKITDQGLVDVTQFKFINLFD